MILQNTEQNVARTLKLNQFKRAKGMKELPNKSVRFSKCSQTKTNLAYLNWNWSYEKE